jgi:membrane-associated phospholipid phosphatase
MGMHQFWIVLSAFGESKLLLPAALIAMITIAFSERPAIVNWLWALGIASAIVLVSKVAFLGWGYGVAAIDFTGFSGHSMVSAAIYPVLGYALGNVRSTRTARAMAVAGALLAVLIGISRLELSAHSPSEVVLGLLIGGAVSALVLARWPVGRVGVRLVAVALGFTLSALAGYSVAPQVRTHDVVVAMALALSGSDVPYTRAELHQRSAGNRPGQS